MAQHTVITPLPGAFYRKATLRLAGGEPLGFRQSDIEINGAALQMRLNAEDPARDFFPSPGLVQALNWPQGEGVRVDSHLYEGYRVPPYYDSLLAKLIVHGRDRAEALARARLAVEQTTLTGMASTLSLHGELLEQPWLHTADFHTGTLETWLAERRSGGAA
jgi:acetyl-CoA carboxylase, biotin carboxylase subunit